LFHVRLFVHRSSHRTHSHAHMHTHTHTCVSCLVASPFRFLACSFLSRSCVISTRTHSPSPSSSPSQAMWCSGLGLLIQCDSTPPNTENKRNTLRMILCLTVCLGLNLGLPEIHVVCGTRSETHSAKRHHRCCASRWCGSAAARACGWRLSSSDPSALPPLPLRLLQVGRLVGLETTAHRCDCVSHCRWIARTAATGSPAWRRGSCVQTRQPVQPSSVSLAARPAGAARSTCTTLDSQAPCGHAAAAHPHAPAGCGCRSVTFSCLLCACARCCCSCSLAVLCGCNTAGRGLTS
jgi:hypothetical protein